MSRTGLEPDLLDDTGSNPFLASDPETPGTPKHRAHSAGVALSEHREQQHNGEDDLHLQTSYRSFRKRTLKGTVECCKMIEIAGKCPLL